MKGHYNNFRISYIQLIKSIYPFYVRLFTYSFVFPFEMNRSNKYFFEYLWTAFIISHCSQEYSEMKVKSSVKQYPPGHAVIHRRR